MDLMKCYKIMMISYHFSKRQKTYLSDLANGGTDLLILSEIKMYLIGKVIAMHFRRVNWS